MVILVVEDERPYLHALMLKLKKAWYEVAWYTNGPEALTFSQSNAIDLALIDIVMPGMNWFSIIEELQGKHKKLPIMVLTNLSQEEDKNRIEGYKVEKFYEKTKVTITEVVEHISQFFTS